MNFIVKYLSFFIINSLVLNQVVCAQQNKFSGWSGIGSLISTDGTQPFWFIHNQNGKYLSNKDNIQFLEAGFGGYYQLNSNLNIDYGLDCNISYSGKFDARINQLFVGFGLKWLVFKAGLFTDPVLFAGLSSSNGSIIRTNNYRPYPKVRLATNGFVPVPFTNNRFFINGEYDEGILLDDRVVDRPRIHHKSFFIRYNFQKFNLKIDLGMNHYVFWGGNSPVYGQLPDGIKDYFRYILGQPGNADFPATDINVAGNQLGDYNIKISKSMESSVLSLYLSHPFEDHSGMELDNIVDNLYGIGLFNKEKGKFVDAVVYEYMYTKHQSGDKHIVSGPKENRMRGRDNYYNHGVYSSGFTHFGFVMCSPLFYPVNIDENGKIIGIANNRLVAHHVGISGYLKHNLQWKSLITWSDNFGRYGKQFDPPKKQLMSYFEVNYKFQNRPYELKIAAGIDSGTLSGNSFGVMLNLIRRF